MSQDKCYLHPMEVVCAWCGRHMKWKSSDRPDLVSHGICDSCKKDVVKEIKAFRSTATSR